MVQSKEEIAKTRKKYYEKNKEKIAKQHKEYSQTKKGKMNHKINSWKQKPKNGYGLICENREEYEYIYDRYYFSSHCEEPKCNKEYTEDNWKCMDHCHDTGLFRNILCHSCNTKRTLKENNSGISNISKQKTGWQYRIVIKGQRYSKYSTDLEWLKEYKIKFEKENLYNL